jgi:hypothetical protein
MWIVDLGGGTIADGRADGTAENGIHDVLEFDYKTPIYVVVTYEEGTTYVLQPLLSTVLARVVPYNRDDLPNSTTGVSGLPLPNEEG